MKKLSVLVPSYNFSEYIEQCIDSIYQQQTDFEFDVIVRDDNSQDGTKNKLNELKQKYPDLIILDGSYNVGALENIKILHGSTDSEYIAYLDGDDICGDKDKFQKQIDFLDKNPNYVMTFTASKYLYDDGTVFPPDNSFIYPLIEKISTKDILEINYVGFGRVFRNITGIFKDYFKDLPYVDWPLNFELSRYGLIGYQNIFGGYYRISESGLFSTISQDKKDEDNLKVMNVLKEKYYNQKYKTITIIDCFVNNESLLGKLNLCIDKLKDHGQTVLLVSNKVPPQNVIEKVDYFIYNHENKLFKEKYENFNYVDLWKNYEKFTIHEVTPELQKHGLSVMCNLFNSVDLAKSLGYTHFQRLEIDSLFTDEGFEFMKTIPRLCDQENKKALFYFNENDISFHYFFSEIDYFINSVERVSDEFSYRNYLKKNGFNNDFKPVEVYMYHNLIRSNPDMILKRDGVAEMNSDFPNTLWNSETSQSTLDDYYGGCTTKIYRINNQDSLAILSFNYNDYPVYRKIEIIYEDRIELLNHRLDCFWSWSYNIVGNNLSKIKVYNSDTDEFLYEVENKDVFSYIEIE